MAVADRAHPDRPAVITVEMQRGVLGDAPGGTPAHRVPAEEPVVPALGRAARQHGVLDNAGRICARARERGIPVVHATVRHRADGIGEQNDNRLFALLARRRELTGHSPTEDGRPGAELVPEITAGPTPPVPAGGASPGVPAADIEVPRCTGVTPFTGTELDALLRRLGVTTIVLVGVSLNLGVVGAALTAVDLGYRVTVVSDAVIGLPVDYGQAVLANTCAMIATIVTTDELLASWDPAGPAGSAS